MGALYGGIGMLVGLRELLELRSRLVYGGFSLVFLVWYLGGLAFLLTNDVIRWAETPSQLKKADTPWKSWRRDRNLTALRVVAGVVVGGATACLVFGVVSGLSVGFVRGAVIGSIAAVIFGIAAGLFAVFTGHHRSWPAYLIATRRLAAEGLLPRDLMSFLDDAHRIGLLRAVGPLYQLRHAEFQDHLA